MKELTDFCVVADPGNSPDPVTGTGRVDYIYEIARCPVTNSEYATFLNAVAAYDDPTGLWSENHEQGLFGGIRRARFGSRWEYRCLPGYDRLPVVYISFFDAARYCNWLQLGRPEATKAGQNLTEKRVEAAYDTRRFRRSDRHWGVRLQNKLSNAPTFSRLPTARYFLPTLDEWNKAAFYEASTEEYWLYPFRSTKPVSEPPPGSAGAANFYGRQWATGEPYLTPVGSYSASPSPYGTLDQGGNVWEWVETSARGVHKWLRGGAATTYVDALARTNIDSENPWYKLFVFGFRVARLPSSP